jgi:phage baseplate assembly protein W
MEVLFMLLPDRLDQRIAEAITHQIEQERTDADAASAAWRSRCEVARVAMLTDVERTAFLHQVSERRGSAAAREMQSQAESLRTNAIFFLARKSP